MNRYKDPNHLKFVLNWNRFFQVIYNRSATLHRKNLFYSNYTNLNSPNYRDIRLKKTILNTKQQVVYLCYNHHIHRRYKFSKIDF